MFTVPAPGLERLLDTVEREADHELVDRFDAVEEEARISGVAHGDAPGAGEVDGAEVVLVDRQVRRPSLQQVRCSGEGFSGDQRDVSGQQDALTIQDFDQVAARRDGRALHVSEGEPAECRRAIQGHVHGTRQSRYAMNEAEVGGLRRGRSDKSEHRAQGRHGSHDGSPIRCRE